MDHIMITSGVKRHHAFILLIVFLLTVLLIFLLIQPLQGKASTVTFSAATIRALRNQAMEAAQVPADAADGWSKSRIDPTTLVPIFRPLTIRTGFVLQAYQFKEGGNGNGFVWAMPANAEFPEPEDCPKLESHLLKAPKPSEALDDVMEAIEGDGSPWSYLAASMLRREFHEFGALWHGSNWSTHVVIDENPWKSPPGENNSPMDRPMSGAALWKWFEDQPTDWKPQVRVETERVTVTFYTFSGLNKEALYRHIDIYQKGKYRPKVEEKRIAEGPAGYAF